jgi:hypothetical protein
LKLLALLYVTTQGISKKIMQQHAFHLFMQVIQNMFLQPVDFILSMDLTNLHATLVSQEHFGNLTAFN